MPSERTRRAFLSTAGALAAGVGGCAATPPRAAPTEDPTGTPTADGRPSDPKRRRVETAHEAVYRQTIGSVGLVRVYASGSQSQGSEFVYDDEYLVTNEHVVDGGEAFQVEFREGEWSMDRAQGAMVTDVIAGEPADGVLRGADDAAPSAVRRYRSAATSPSGWVAARRDRSHASLSIWSSEPVPERRSRSRSSATGPGRPSISDSAAVPRRADCTCSTWSSERGKTSDTDDSRYVGLSATVT